MAFDFTSSKDRDWVTEMSPWAVHEHCLNLQEADVTLRVSEIDFSNLPIWVQVHGISLEMLNSENASQIASMLGKCVEMERESYMQNRDYIRLNSEINVGSPLQAGLWWTNARGEEKWADFRYESLSDVCYTCGMLGHSSQACQAEAVVSEVNL